MKKIILIFSFLVLSITTYAQVGISILGGATLDYTVLREKSYDGHVQPLIGIGVGYNFTFKNFFTEPTFNIVHKYYGKNYRNFTTELFLPVGYKFNFGLKVLTGVYGTYIIDSKLYDNYTDVSNGTYKRVYANKDKLFGIRGGVGYDFSKLGIALIYSEQLTSHGQIGTSNFSSGLVNYYNREAMIRLTYYFK